MTRAVSFLSILLVALSGCGGGAADPDGGTGGPCQDAVVPFARSDADKVLRFDLTAGCVPITFEPTMPEGDRTTIKAVLAAWGSIPGSKLCFGTPTDASNDPEDPSDRRIHFRSVPQDDPNANVTSNAHVNSTGIIVFDVVIYAAGQGNNKALLLSLVGSAIGLGFAPGGSDSAMAQPATLTTPTTHDQTAVAALYGGTCAF